MAPTESTPLLPTSQQSAPPKPQRTVTFNPQVSSASPPRSRPSIGEAGASRSTGSISTAINKDVPVLSALNSKLRRRNSSGAPLQLPGPASKIGPQRTTVRTQKLKLLPNPELGDDGPDEESGREVYSQFTRIKDPTARRDAARLGKEDRDKLPRVTAYCTANSYRLDDLMRFIKGRSKSRSAQAKLFDECIYTTYSYQKDGGEARSLRRPSGDFGGELQQNAAVVHSQPQRRFSDSAIEVEENTEHRRQDLIDLQIENGQTPLPNSSTTNLLAEASDTYIDETSPAHIERPITPDFDTIVHIPEVFLFEYGVVVIWGMTEKEEQRFLKEIAKFEQEKLGKDDIQTEEFNFYYTREYQARIYNDFISLREKRNYMTKLAISHALAQSVKTSLYEDLVDATISTTQSIPSTIAQTGRINLTRREINQQIGELFILRINIHLQGSVLDAPELMWAEPQLDPVYQAVRSYLEMDQRVGLLTERLEVISDLLQVLKDQLTHTHAEILVAAINIIVDLYAGVD
ncbi:hypothetical protein MRB53_037779 [Persea americana]|nr:hypothetical protein MRB53_037779 [Persea americana]